MKCFSLFSGIGGFDLALKRQGHEIVGACEIDKYARSVYSRHFPEVPVWEDATKINPEELPDFEMLCAGFPCQPFSTAGKRLGFEDTRGTLFFEIVRIAKEKRPRYLFLENVAGLLYHEDHKTFTTILNTLDELGYDAEWQVVNGKHFLPQKRARLFIIGHSREKPIRKIFPLGEVHNLHPQKEKKSGQVVNCLTAGGHSGGLHSQMTIIMLGHNSQNGTPFDFDEVFTLTTRDEQAIQKDGKFRQLTPLEYERLQGFPDGWTEGLSDTKRKFHVGNAVMVPKIEYILSKLE